MRQLDNAAEFIFVHGKQQQLYKQLTKNETSLPAPITTLMTIKTPFLNCKKRMIELMNFFINCPSPSISVHELRRVMKQIESKFHQSAPQQRAQQRPLPALNNLSLNDSEDAENTANNGPIHSSPYENQINSNTENNLRRDVENEQHQNAAHVSSIIISNENSDDENVIIQEKEMVETVMRLVNAQLGPFDDRVWPVDDEIDNDIERIIVCKQQLFCWGDSFHRLFQYKQHRSGMTAREHLSLDNELLLAAANCLCQICGVSSILSTNLSSILSLANF